MPYQDNANLYAQEDEEKDLDEEEVKLPDDENPEEEETE